MAILADKLDQTKAAAIEAADARVRGTVLDEQGNPVLAPDVAQVLDYANELKIQLDALLGTGIRRAGDPEAVPTDITSFFRWIVDVPFALTQQLELGMTQVAATMQVLSDSMGSRFAELAPRLAQAQADAAASLLNDQALRADLTANGLADAATRSRTTALELRATAIDAKQVLSDTAQASLQASQQLTASRLAVVEQAEALVKTQADATAAGLALVQAQQAKDEQLIATAQQQLTATQALASSTAAALTGLQNKVATDEQALSAVQQAVVTADAKAVVAQQAAATAQAKADADATAAAAAKTQADTALAAAQAAQAAAVAVGARFREFQVSTPAVTLAALAVQAVAVVLPTAYADDKYGIAFSRQGAALLGVDISWSAKTATGFTLSLKNTGAVSLAIAASTLDVVTTHA